jgi:uncharacterized protein
MTHRNYIFIALCLCSLLIANTLTAQSISSDVSSVASARISTLGTSVAAAGWVSATTEFGPLVFFQDNTAGIAVVSQELASAVQPGDSIVVRGILSEINPAPGATGNGLRTIGGESLSFEVYPAARITLEPRITTIAELNSGAFEGQLVRIDAVSINVLNTTSRFVGQFASDQLYTIRSGSFSTRMRIHPQTNIVGAQAPDVDINVVGIAYRFNSLHQMLPRTTADIQRIIPPGGDVPTDKSLDIATWNIEWFGDTSNGPSDETLQFQNVKRAIETLDKDIYALQEISNVTVFNRLISELPGYNGLIAPISPTQRMAYLYKTSTISVIQSGSVATTASWANGRFPFMILVDATINGVTTRIRLVNFHAKAFSSESDYNQRVSDANVLKQYADARNVTDKLIILGDYNDRIVSSTWNNATSPYAIFDNDSRYYIVTKPLEVAGATSYRSVSMIDHIMINEKLFENHIEGTQRVEDMGFITGFLSNTSDHYPVSTRFVFADPTSIGESAEEIPSGMYLMPNYPNPFNPTTQIQFELPQTTDVRLAVYDVLGRQVALLRNGMMSAGRHEVRFDAGSLSSGIYIYRLESADGTNITRKMMLVR